VEPPMLKHCIVTASGNLYDFDETDNTFNLDDIAHSLGFLCRFTGHCRKFYSVAAHSILVHYLVTTVFGRPDLGAEALMHDATEFAVNDLSSPFKGTVPDYKQAEHDVAFYIALRFGLTADATIKKADWLAYCIERHYLMPNTSVVVDEVAGRVTSVLFSGHTSLRFRVLVTLCSWFPKLAVWRFKQIARKEGLYD
jgi:hypothetical protein